MEHKEGCDRNQEILFPPKIDDYVGEENLVRFIEAFVSMLNLIELGFTHAEPKATGRPSYTFIVNKISRSDSSKYIYLMSLYFPFGRLKETL